LPSWLLEGTANRLEAGSKKYSAWNWMQGDYASELMSSLERHLIAFKKGETIDPDKNMNGTDHIDGIICNALFLKHMLAEHPELDDRVIISQKNLVDSK
jgi:hypothetical protein